MFINTPVAKFGSSVRWGSDSVVPRLPTGRVWYPRADVLQCEKRVGVGLQRQHGGRQRADPGVLLPVWLPVQLQPHPTGSGTKFILCITEYVNWNPQGILWTPVKDDTHWCDVLWPRMLFVLYPYLYRLYGGWYHSGRCGAASMGERWPPGVH